MVINIIAFSFLYSVWCFFIRSFYDNENPFRHPHADFSSDQTVFVFVATAGTVNDAGKTPG
ncbi:hypothetical protein [Citrobacter sp. Marseille-Q6884]|uniref:hypothetical protein n=1 Tax=Citrobacter sp. Marseille-Q6884 TaxID=2956786 RepID=UPI0021B4146A|nr:hypothetical protein [Citrobacter sp. Marseille-Q6884]